MSLTEIVCSTLSSLQRSKRRNGDRRNRRNPHNDSRIIATLTTSTHNLGRQHCMVRKESKERVLVLSHRLKSRTSWFPVPELREQDRLPKDKVAASSSLQSRTYTTTTTTITITASSSARRLYYYFSLSTTTRLLTTH